jgi:hypothetical protein
MGCLLVLVVLSAVAAILPFLAKHLSLWQLAVLYVAFIVLMTIWLGARWSRVNPDRRSEKAFGPRNWHIVCPQCQIEGTVRALSIKADSETLVSAAGPPHENDVLRAHCDNCGANWEIPASRPVA